MSNDVASDVFMMDEAWDRDIGVVAFSDLEVADDGELRCKGCGAARGMLHNRVNGAGLMCPRDARRRC